MERQPKIPFLVLYVIQTTSYPWVSHSLTSSLLSSSSNSLNSSWGRNSVSTKESQYLWAALVQGLTEQETPQYDKSTWLCTLPLTLTKKQYLKSIFALSLFVKNCDMDIKIKNNYYKTLASESLSICIDHLTNGTKDVGEKQKCWRWILTILFSTQ